MDSRHVKSGGGIPKSREAGQDIEIFQQLKFAERNKGRLQVESKYGKGTTFKLYLPSKDKAA